MERHYVGVFLLGPSLGCVHDFIREGSDASRYLYWEPERKVRTTILSLRHVIQQDMESPMKMFLNR